MQFNGYVVAILYVLLTVSCAAAEAERAEMRNLLNSDCHDDNMTDRCDPAEQQRVRNLYGARTIEDLAAANVQVRRAFYVDGYGRDMPMIAFERAPGADPRVTVSVSIDNDAEEPRVVTLTAPASLDQWNAMLEETQQFHRTLTPIAPDDPDAIAICLHSWVVTMEAADPRGRPAVRRRTEDACNDGLAVDAGFDLAERAYQLLPQCRALAREKHRNLVALFQHCAFLEGDRIAAAEAMNQWIELDGLHRAPTANDLSPYIEYQPTLTWPGEAPVRRLSDAVAYWARVIELHASLGRVFGEGPDRVRITGRLFTRDDPAQSAAFEQTWLRHNGGAFQLEEMRVEPFAAP